MNDNETAFTRLLREHRGTIYTVCYMFSNDQDEVADLFQETSINLWRGFHSFEGRSDIRSWIYRVALNTCISFDRKKKRQKTVPLTMDINLFEDDSQENRQTKLLHDRINRLQPFDRAIILLWLEAMPYDEIAEIVGISTKNVSVKLARIREQLKKMK